LAPVRRAALERFESRSLPTEAEEVWRYSRIDELDLDEYRVPPATGADRPVPTPVSSLVDAVGPASGLAVTHNGSLAALVAPSVPGLELLWGGGHPAPVGEVAGEPDAFVTLNTACLSGPLTVRVARGQAVADPVVVVHWVDADAAAVFPRTIATIEEDAEVRIVEIIASSDVRALVVPVTELDLGPAARLGYVNLQTLGRHAWQIGLQASRIGRDGDLVSQSVAFGGDYARVRTDSTLAGKGGSSRLLAVYFGDGGQMHDFRTVQAHAGEKTVSDLLFKGAVADQAHSVYSGLIRIDKGAVGSNAFQTNRNLVLGEGAHADSVPNLEIEENDVHCSHASAVGPIDEEQRFYLESRGVPPEVADRLIALGFLGEVLERTPVPGLLPWMRTTLTARLDRVVTAS
jgi:Fe-S cluster assembly protein SufD